MRKVLQLGVVFLVVCGTARGASAQMVVQDPANLVQNTMSAVKEGEALIKQIKELKKTIEMLKQMKKDLEQLSTRSLDDLGRTFRELKSLYNQGEQLSMRWQRIGRQFNEKYEKYDPELEGKQTYRQKRKKWNKQTDEALRSAMISHGVVSKYDKREDSLEQLVDASDNAEGTLAAIQAGNRIAAVMVRQMKELTEIIVADSRARLSYIQERRRNRQASEADGKENLMEGYGETDSYEKPPDSWPEVQ